MLSYQHSFHAGNFADVHKHFTLSLLLESLNRKSKPWSYFETHSGSAIYDLLGEQANKTNEFKQGILKIHQQNLPSSLEPYLSVLRSLNSNDESLSLYPGSPWIASQFSKVEGREGDRLSLMELHPAEYENLKSVFRRDKNVGVHHRDGYEGVLSLLPPKPNRGVVLIDPSYEVKDEYLQVVSFLVRAHQRWSNGCFAVWYPLLKAGYHKEMLHKLKFSGIRNILKSEFHVKEKSYDRMYGSGMLIINPPWQLEEKIQHGCESLFSHLSDEAAVLPETAWLVPE